MSAPTRLSTIIVSHDKDLLAEWIKAILAAGTGREDLLKAGELQQQCRDLLDGLRKALAAGNLTNLQAQEWAAVRDLLAAISRTRAAQGFSPSDVARFVFSLKQPLFARLRAEFANDTKALADETWTASLLIDSLGLFTVESYLKAKEDMIRRQQEEMLELSTPVVKLWDGILALPLIGTLDSARTQVVMETLLQKVVQTGSEVAIIDITGVPTVDTLVAQHLLKTVTAARLMGTDCIISGIRPQIAQTIVHLGVDLSMVITKSSLADAFQVALQRLDLSVVRRKATATGATTAATQTPGIAAAVAGQA
jgi:rsbT co-antagonist protein RsbR